MTLSEVLHRLTHTHDRTSRVTDPVTGIPETITHPHPALLDELERMISENRAQAVKAARIGSVVPLTSDAHELAGIIRSTLQEDIKRHTEQRIYGNLAAQALTWYRLWSSRERWPAETGAWLETLTDWEARILAMTNAPTELVAVEDVTCPICGYARITDGEDSKTAVTVRYHPDAPGDTCELVCRKCGPVAQGVNAARAALRITRITAAG